VLVGKTTFTVAENLILGCLIVIFVVVLLLGNWRSGLSGSLCYSIVSIICDFVDEYFGIDANLMSLGAIDFGIIIDGASLLLSSLRFK
jgi:cobalt-zinc-cadmium resistance protein CzcA